jgi:hypothetical protein
MEDSRAGGREGRAAGVKYIYIVKLVVLCELSTNCFYLRWDGCGGNDGGYAQPRRDDE